MDLSSDNREWIKERYCAYRRGGGIINRKMRPQVFLHNLYLWGEGGLTRRKEKFCEKKKV